MQCGCRWLVAPLHSHPFIVCIHVLEKQRACRLRRLVEPLLTRQVLLANSTALAPPKAIVRGLSRGRYRLSKFGPYCPVVLKEQSRSVADRATGGMPQFPVLYRRHVYCLSSAEAARRFAANPTYFIQQMPAPPARAPSAIIIGGPMR